MNKIGFSEFFESFQQIVKTEGSFEKQILFDTKSQISLWPCHLANSGCCDSMFLCSASISLLN